MTFVKTTIAITGLVLLAQAATVQIVTAQEPRYRLHCRPGADLFVNINNDTSSVSVVVRFKR